MAKKRKRAAGAAAPAADEEAADDATAPAEEERPAKSGRTAAAPGALRARVGSFTVKSSLKVPFLAVSKKSFVEGLPKPSVDEWTELLSVVDEIVNQWEKSSAVLMADFEGEMPGFEGHLLTATFQRTLAVDSKGLRPMSVGSASKEMGLFIDMRCADGVRAVKRIMESEAISKLIWGADGDITSLRYTPPAKPMGIESTSVVDVQLGFSAQSKRLGMASMLQRLPTTAVAGLPGKSVIDFNTNHAANRRVLSFPLSTTHAVYAVDDLHRLDAILRTQKPKAGSYMPARNETASFCALVLKNPVGVSAPKLKQQQLMMRASTGTKRTLAAVRIKRHLIAVRMLGVPHGGEFAELEKAADEVLAEQAVTVPDDLSFSAED